MKPRKTDMERFEAYKIDLLKIKQRFLIESIENKRRLFINDSKVKKRVVRL